MSSTRFNAHFDTPHRGPPYPFKDAGAVADSAQCHGEVPLRCQQAMHTQRCLGVPTGKNPEDDNLASMEAVQWAPFFLYISHDRCY
jgi:hypothetical protein